ncbi:ThiF family adenylyltransferase [Amycolatopsis sp. NPDC026612]|uniref:ThiF family adenylyltransferase n=1 Tax=Amycolatopsis sp. NPDC026612 TaxID=3155466 RepID=UPI0033CB10FD
MTRKSFSRTPGQAEAFDQLLVLARASAGDLAVAEVSEPASDEGPLLVELDINCAGAVSGRSSVPLGERERVTIAVPALYPLQQPRVRVAHRRFAGLPHVVWGVSICLYVAQYEWNPGVGMTDVIARLVTWFEHVAAGTITGPEVPWDPPITNLAGSPGRLLVRRNLPNALEDDESIWLGGAVIESVGRRKYEVRRWLDLRQAGQWVRAAPANRGGEPGRTFLAPVVALPGPVAFTYPTQLAGLLAGLGTQGLDSSACASLIDWARASATAATDGAGQPDVAPLGLILLGSRARPDSPIRGRIAHFAAWWADFGVEQGAVRWMRVEDQRPSITLRRDHRRPARWLHGKRVLVLGCGALGAPIAEFCVRGGARRVQLVDQGVVHHGLLVRQPYRYDDIGYPKAEVLGERLRQTSPDVSIEDSVVDAVQLVRGEAGLPEVDLVIDATANRAVAAALELTWRDHAERPPLLSVMVSRTCEIGVATLALPGSGVAGVDVLRQLLLAASEDDGLRDLLDDLLPDVARTEVFQPEPGCSDPTFAGSAADLAGFAGQLFTDALALLGLPSPEGVLTPRKYATVVRSPSGDSPGVQAHRHQWTTDVVRPEAGHGYQARIAATAFAAIRQEVLRSRELRGPECETGGLLLGQVDHAAKIVWITEVSGLPPGSAAWAEGLVLDAAEQRGRTAERRRRSRGLVGYLGMWHTHPRHQATPSTIDRTAMAGLTRNDAPAVLLIAGGNQEKWARWLDGAGRPETHVELFFPDPGPGPGGPPRAARRRRGNGS